MDTSFAPPPGSEPSRYAAQPAPAPTSRPRWSAGRTAVVAGVTIVLVSAGAIGAAAALPLGADRGVSGSPGGDGQFPGGGQVPGGGQLPGRGQLPGGPDGAGQPQDGSQLPQLPQLPDSGGTDDRDSGTGTTRLT